MMIEEIRGEVNRLAVGRPIGELQSFRKKFRNMTRIPSNVLFGDIRDYDPQKAPESQYPYIFHVGGRDELQFNIGVDRFGDLENLRVGVAFSFAPSQSYPDIEPLLKKVQLFNDYIREHGDDFSDMWMWHYSNGKRSEKRQPGPISPNMAQVNNFVFMGNLFNYKSPNYDFIMNTLDRLFPIWKFVEENFVDVSQSPIRKPRCKGRPKLASFAQATLQERLLDINLRHNVLLTKLVNGLIDCHGEDFVRWEDRMTSNGLCDVLLEKGGCRTIYEIKTSATARGCIREAMGQLLEYGFWPGGEAPSKLVVVGEPEMDSNAEKYLERLNEKFPAKISYLRIDVI
jgi:hypothetical protein